MQNTRKNAWKNTWIAAASALVLTGSLVLAQNANTGPGTAPGDATVSPSAATAVGGSGRTDPPNPTDRPNLGAGLASGALNNGTTGDTIGTGSGTTSAPAAGATNTTGARKE
jgi:hypothetical protein